MKAIEAGEFKKFVNATGKSLERKGKRLFMPFRVALTGRMQGPEVGDVLDLLVAEGAPASAVSLDARIEQLKAQSAAWASEGTRKRVSSDPRGRRRARRGRFSRNRRAKRFRLA